MSKCKICGVAIKDVDMDNLCNNCYEVDWRLKHYLYHLNGRKNVLKLLNMNWRDLKIDYTKYTTEVEFMLEGAVLKRNDFIKSNSLLGSNNKKTIRDFHYFVERFSYLHGLLAAISYGSSITSTLQNNYPSLQKDYIECNYIFKNFYLKWNNNELFIKQDLKRN